MKVRYVCPLPEDQFPWYNHYGGSDPICSVCGLNLDDLEAVTEKIRDYLENWLKTYHKLDVQVLPVYYDKTTDNRDCGVISYKVNGRLLVVWVIKNWSSKRTKVREYTIIAGQEDDNKTIVVQPFGSNGLGLAMQLMKFPSRLSPILKEPIGG